MNFKPFKSIKRPSDVPPVPAVPTAAPGVRDAYGRLIQEGDEFVFHGMIAPRYRLTSMVPILNDPQAPPGALRLTFQGTVIIGVPGNAVVQQILRVQTVEEAIAIGAIKRVEQPPADATVPAKTPAGEDVQT